MCSICFLEEQNYVEPPTKLLVPSWLDADWMLNMLLGTFHRRAKMMETVQFNAINCQTAMGLNLRQVKIISMRIVFVSCIKIFKHFTLSFFVISIFSPERTMNIYGRKCLLPCRMQLALWKDFVI